MCWNPDISINTFLFSSIVLLFIYFTNTYTKYKTPLFDNPIVYIFILITNSLSINKKFKNVQN